MITMNTLGNLVNIERAIHELKCGRAVIIAHPTFGTLTFCASETIPSNHFELFKMQQSFIVFTKNRLSLLEIAPDTENHYYTTPLAPLSYNDLSSLAWQTKDDASVRLNQQSFSCTNELQDAALTLTVLSVLKHILI